MVNWVSHRAHRLQTIADTGQWVGLLDENGLPLMDLPSTIDIEANAARGSVEEIQATIGVITSTGATHAAVDELIADGLGIVDAQGELVPIAAPTRMVAVERPGERRCYRVTHCVAVGPHDAPHTLQIFGVDVAGMLETIPAWSAPKTVTGQWNRLERDFVAKWATPRTLQSIELAAQADGFTIGGPALAAIWRVISESLETTWRAENITADPPIVAVKPAPNPASPNVLIRPTDDPLWDQIADTALMAGITIAAQMWLPEDAQPPGLDAPLVRPTIVITLEQQEI